MKTIYWASTSLISAIMLWSAYGYLFQKAMIDGVRDLGFPDHFRVMLAVMKVLAVIALMVPMVPLQVKEWAYAGVGFFLIMAIVAHTAHKDPVFFNVLNLVFLAILAVSNVYLHKLFG